jgi:4-hydroxy-tetrahydrodipicolinate synthase
LAFSLLLKLEGIWCPLATPLDHHGDGVNVNGVKELVNYEIENGIDGLLPLGTSGEFALLSEVEKKTLLKQVVDTTNDRVPVVAGVSDPCVENVVQFSKDAKDVGVDAVIATPPYYYSTTTESLYGYYKALSDKVELPLLIYNIPAWTGNYVGPDIVKCLADEKCVVGMKYTQYNFLNLLEFLTSCGKQIAVFTGSDALAYSNLEFGGCGAIIGVANLAPGIASKIYDEFKSANMDAARETQEKLLPLIKSMTIGEFPAGLKYAMNLIGLNVGPAKTPLPPLNDDEKARVEKLLRDSKLVSLKGSAK